MSRSGKTFTQRTVYRHTLTPYLRLLLLTAIACALGLGLARSVVRAADDTEPYLVKEGDTLAAIAVAHGLTVNGLLALNPDLADVAVVYVGEILQVPSRVGPPPAVAVVCPLAYTVRSVDTLTTIAAAHGVDTGLLAQVNHRELTGALVAGTHLCIPVVSPDALLTSDTPPPVSRLACEGEVQYVLSGPRPGTFVYSTEALPPGLQVCVQSSLKVTDDFSILKVTTEAGETNWIPAHHVGPWTAYLVSLDPSAPTPTVTPHPTPTPTPTTLPCRDAWGASAVGYRVRQGPGTQYVHTGLYVRAGQLVCELRRDQGWVFIRLADGVTGWVHVDGLTRTRPTPTPIPSPTPVPTSKPVAQPDGYYAQTLETRGVLIKAGSNVDPKALLVVKDTVDLMLAAGSRRGLPECLKKADAFIAIIPWDEKISVLPEFAHLKGRKHPYDGSPLDDVRGALAHKHEAATNEENVLNLPSNIAPGIDTTMHEFAHIIQEICFTSEEQARWEGLYEQAKAVTLFPLDAYLMAYNDGEFFAVLTTVYFNETDELHPYGIPRNGGREALKRKLAAADMSEILTFIEEIYGAR